MSLSKLNTIFAVFKSTTFLLGRSLDMFILRGILRCIEKHPWDWLLQGRATGECGVRLVLEVELPRFNSMIPMSICDSKSEYIEYKINTHIYK